MERAKFVLQRHVVRSGLGERRVAYYRIEDGHTGVLFEVLQESEFEIGGQTKGITVTELFDAVQRRFLVLHVESGPYHGLLLKHLGFREFDMCPFYRECRYLFITRNDEDRDYDQVRGDPARIAAQVDGVTAFLKEGLNLWRQAEEAWARLNRLLKDAGGREFPSLEEMVWLVPEYGRLKEELERLKKEKKRGF